MTTDSTSRLPRALAPFALRQYRWLAGGLALALFGDGIWLIAVVWQVIGIGGGPGRVSLVSGVTAVAMIAATLFGGVLADRISQRTIVFGLEAVKLLAFGSVAVASLLHVLSFPHLLVAAILGGITTGMYYPAYSALLPRIVHADQLLAANGVEGFMRPVLYQAAGPMIAGAIIGISSPGIAILVGAVASSLAGLCYLVMGPVDESDHAEAKAVEAAAGEKPSVVRDLGEGFAYMWRTPWLWSSLFFYSLQLLAIMGPIEVLVPFALRERVGGDASDHAMVLAAFGIGAALAAAAFGAFPMPKRYLTVMFAMWSVGSLPLIIMGRAHHVVWFVVAAFMIGVLIDGPAVLWGTLLQRRTPKHLLGRISALDFFVSAALMPVSMALAAPISHWIGFGPTFIVAGLLPVPLAVIFYFAAKLWRDEIEHPLGIVEDEVPLDEAPAA
ncbi:MAG: MFS transporter [Gordonia sp. (in: high G+C Gram-positive bacteria)]|uniref:MFS transporter n=1 Tax=Gordonia sp. (in: high G+C Gram-positive bacteria) TaxID=84139 RepID=UPI0039E53E9D